MTKSSLLLIGALAVFSSYARAEDASVSQNDNAAADELMGGDLMGTDDLGVDAAAGDAPVETAQAPRNKALEKLDSMKIGRGEIMAFMKAGGLKSRLMK